MAGIVNRRRSRSLICMIVLMGILSFAALVNAQYGRGAMMAPGVMQDMMGQGGARAEAKVAPTDVDTPRITKEALKSMLGNPDVIILDVRLEKHWTASGEKIPGKVGGQVLLFDITPARKAGITNY